MYTGRTGKDVRRLKPVSLLQRFSLLSLSAFLAVGILLGWVITNSLEEDFVARSKEVTASFVREEFERLFKREDFSAPMEGALYEEFLAKSPHLRFNSDIKRVKVWNRDMVVVWSDDRRLLGQRFPENKELKKALKGKLASELKVLDKEENRYERQYSRLLELYVPVRTRADGTVDTVFEIYQENLPPVRGDEMLLEQVVMNLEINACHAMGDQGAITIRANPVQDGSAVEFSVSDTGHGIPEYQRNQIFLPYFTTKEKGKGTGLGLFISKRIVDQHSGSIETHSIVGRGTTFTVRLPAASGSSPAKADNLKFKT